VQGDRVEFADREAFGVDEQMVELAAVRAYDIRWLKR